MRTLTIMTHALYVVFISVSCSVVFGEAQINSCALLLANFSKISSNSTEAYLNLLAALVKNKNALSSSDLMTLLSQSQAVNPADFVTTSLAPEDRHAFRVAFDKTIKGNGVNSLDWERIKGEVESLRSGKSQTEEKSSKAKEDTRGIWGTFPLKREAVPSSSFFTPRYFHFSDGSGFLHESNSSVTKIGSDFIVGTTKDHNATIIDSKTGKILWSTIKAKLSERRAGLPLKQVITYKDYDGDVAATVLFGTIFDKNSVIIDWHRRDGTVNTHDLPRGGYVLEDIGQGRIMVLGTTYVPNTNKYEAGVSNDSTGDFLIREISNQLIFEKRFKKDGRFGYSPLCALTFGKAGDMYLLAQSQSYSSVFNLTMGTSFDFQVPFRLEKNDVFTNEHKIKFFKEMSEGGFLIATQGLDLTLTEVDFLNKKFTTDKLFSLGQGRELRDWTIKYIDTKSDVPYAIAAYRGFDDKQIEQMAIFDLKNQTILNLDTHTLQLSKFVGVYESAVGQIVGVFEISPGDLRHVQLYGPPAREDGE